VCRLINSGGHDIGKIEKGYERDRYLMMAEETDRECKKLRAQRPSRSRPFPTLEPELPLERVRAGTQLRVDTRSESPNHYERACLMGLMRLTTPSASIGTTSVAAVGRTSGGLRTLPPHVPPAARIRGLRPASCDWGAAGSLALFALLLLLPPHPAQAEQRAPRPPARPAERAPAHAAGATRGMATRPESRPPPPRGAAPATALDRRGVARRTGEER